MTWDTLRPVRPPTRTALLAVVVATAALLPATSSAAPGPGFLRTDAGRPARWDPCAPVPWSLSPGGTPAGRAAVHAAVAELSRHTGLDLRWAGPTRTRPTGAVVAEGAPRRLVIGWTTPERSDLLAGRTRTTVGVTRVRWRSRGGPPLLRAAPQIDAAVVALNAQAVAPSRGPGSWYAYALHELAHAVGLAHAPDGTAGSIMTPLLDRGLAAYGPTDVAGLARLGGCGRSRPAPSN